MAVGSHLHANEKGKGRRGSSVRDDVQVIHDGKNERDKVAVRLICL